MNIKLSDHFTYKKLFRFTLSPIIMMVFTSIYGVVDGFFVSNYVGKNSFAAINLIMPFLMIIGGMGFMVGTGGSALTAKTLGEGDNKRANAYFTMIVKFTVILGIILSVFGIVFIRPIAHFLGADSEMIGECIVYGRVILVFNIAFMLQNVFQSFLVTAEKPRLGLVATVAAGVTNMVLDALFIAGFKWGVAGAAAATGISQVVGGILPLIYFLKPNNSLLRLTSAKLKAKPLLSACANGSSELMSNISSSVVSMIYNFQLLKYIGEDGISAYGVLMYVQFIFIAIYIGYAIGSAPVISFHYGARNHPELKNLLKKSTVLMGGSGVLLFAAALVLSAPLSRIFVGYDKDLFELTNHAFKLFSFSFLLCGFNIFASSFFTALNDGGVSAAISFLRTLLFQTASVLLFPLLFDIDGIWLSKTTAEISAFAVSLVFIIAKRKKYNYI